MVALRRRWLSRLRGSSFKRRKESRDLRFFLRAFREADPDFGGGKEPAPREDLMSREWLTRSMR